MYSGEDMQSSIPLSEYTKSSNVLQEQLSNPERLTHVSSDELLLKILESLERLEARSLQDAIAREKYQAESRRQKELDALKQLCSMFAAIAILIATLGATALQYAQDAFNSRPSGPAADNRVYTLLFISIFLSIIATLFLAYGVKLGSKAGWQQSLIPMLLSLLSFLAGLVIFVWDDSGIV